jgi:hypothetical protein
VAIEAIISLLLVMISKEPLVEKKVKSLGDLYETAKRFK